MLAISKWIIDLVVESVKHPGPLPNQVWWLLAAEFVLAAPNQVLGRAIDYTDARLADEFTREVSLRVMEHATRLDLASFEDPAFHDMLERARQQATDRIGMLNAMGRLLLQSITLISLSVGVIFYSPWLFLLLVICIVPAFMGESHFAFLGYSLAHEITPVRRELDYLRVIGTSKENAKEVKLFGLGGYLHERYASLTGGIIRKNINLTRHRLVWGSVFADHRIRRLLRQLRVSGLAGAAGRISVGTFMFLTGAIAGSSTQLQGVFSLFSHISDQALFLDGPGGFPEGAAHASVRPDALPAPRPIRTGFEFRDVSFHYPGLVAPGAEEPELSPGARRARRAGW